MLVVMTYDAQRQLIRALAQASHNFDRVRGALLRDANPIAPTYPPASPAHPPAPAYPANAQRSSSHPSQPRATPPASPTVARGRSVAAAAGHTAADLALAAGGAAVATGRALAGVHPRHTEWATASLDARIAWWVQRFGTAAAALAAVPGLLGRLGRVSGVGDVLGAAAQILIVNAVARELGVEDIPRRVVVAADIVLGRQLDRGTVLRALEDESHDAHRPPDADDGIEAPRRLGRTATLIWQVARDLRRVNKDLDNRPGAGRFVALMRNLPAVGAASAFAYERRGIARAADQARDAFGRP